MHTCFPLDKKGHWDPPTTIPKFWFKGGCPGSKSSALRWKKGVKSSWSMIYQGGGAEEIADPVSPSPGGGDGAPVTQGPL